MSKWSFKDPGSGEGKGYTPDDAPPLSREWEDQKPFRRDYEERRPYRRDDDQRPRRSFRSDDRPRRSFDRDSRPPRREPVSWRAGEEPEDRVIEEMNIWKTARELFGKVHAAIHACGDTVLRDRLLGVTFDLVGGIANGAERGSQGGFMRLLEDARGHCGEIRSLLHLATDLGHLGAEISAELRAAFAELNKSLAGWQRPVRREY